MRVQVGAMLNVLICERWSCGPTMLTIGPEAAVIDSQSGPSRSILGVVRVRRLKPGSRKTQVEIDGVFLRKLEVEAVEHVLFVAVIVEDLVFGSIEEAARVQAAGGDEVSPLVLPVGQIETTAGAAKRAVGSGYIAVGFRHAQP